MFNKKRNNNYQEYIDYENNPEIDDIELDEIREYHMDSNEPQQENEWQNDGQQNYYQDQDYSENLEGYSRYGKQEHESDSRHEYVSRRQQNTYNENHTPELEDYHYQDELDYGNEKSNDFTEERLNEENSTMPRRTKYSARIDRFLNNGIIIVGVLLIIVLVIAFLL